MKQIWKTFSNFEQLLVEVIDILNFFEKFSAQRGWGGWVNVEMLTIWPLTVDNMFIIWAPLNVAPTCWTLFEVLNVRRQEEGGVVRRQRSQRTREETTPRRRIMPPTVPLPTPHQIRLPPPLRRRRQLRITLRASRLRKFRGLTRRRNSKSSRHGWQSWNLSLASCPSYMYKRRSRFWRHRSSRVSEWYIVYYFSY